MKYSNEEKEMWLEDWERSGKSAWAYAQENGINRQTFLNWTKTRGSATQFVEVTRQIQPERGIRGQEVVIEKGDIKIHIPVEVLTDDFRPLLKTLMVAV